MKIFIKYLALINIFINLENLLRLNRESTFYYEKIVEISKYEKIELKNHFLSKYIDLLKLVRKKKILKSLLT